MSTRFATLLFVVFILVLFLFSLFCPQFSVGAQTEDPQPQPYKIFMPYVRGGNKTPAAFRLDTKPLNIYMEDVDGVCDGLKDGSTASADKRHFCTGDGAFDYVFKSSTYYGYFRDANTANEINTGITYNKVIAMTVDLDQESSVVSMFREQYPGSIVFGQRLTATVKIIVYQK